ncbi:MAG: hypothetical protein ACI8X5_003654 [Planctomycetota bacterium]|jgi:hypothetical protein
MKNTSLWFRLRFLLLLLVGLSLGQTASAQVDYQPSGWPWTAQTNSGPDAQVPGWFYNLGITGLRIELVANAPKEMVVRYVIPGSPADGVIQVGAHVTGTGGANFLEPHQDGYGTDVFGAQGPVGEFAAALEAAQSATGNGKLRIRVTNGSTASVVLLNVGQTYGAFSPSYPESCPKSRLILSELLEYLVINQGANGSWGNPVNNLYASLALLTSNKPAHQAAAKSCAQNLANTTAPTSNASLVNWRFMTAGIVLSEYYLKTGEAWVLPELTEVRDFLLDSQYTSHSQVDPNAQISHPHTYPNDPLDSFGGWGHNPGFEGYGPISMLTGEGALVFALMERCGISVDQERHEWAYEFLARGTGNNGYLWYKDEVASNTNWADHGRTGASGVANWLSPYSDSHYHRDAIGHIVMIGENSQSFPDTHGSPILGMGFAAMATSFMPEQFRSLMDENLWWFALAQCPDGSYYYQPNRDNAGYGADSRISASAVTAFMFSIPLRKLVVTGKP